MLTDGAAAFVEERYAGWDSGLGQDIRAGKLRCELPSACSRQAGPEPRSGRQEMLENLVNRYL